jgi:flagellar basal-body rod protein FlgB
MIVSRTSKMNESLLDILSLKNKVIANNIANADTPRYKTQTVQFQEELLQQLAKGANRSLPLKRTNPNHLPMKSDLSAIPHNVVEIDDTVMNNNLNNVDIDTEMSNLAKNQLTYNVIVDRVSGHYKKHKTLLADLK